MKKQSELPLPGYQALAILFFVLAASAAHAANYDVGQSQTYTTLEALRTNRQRPAWQDGDTITLHGNDNSLRGEFDFGGAEVQIQGSGKIMPSGKAGTFRFASTGDAPITVIPGDGQTLTFEGFGNIDSSGRVINAGGSAVTLGDFGSIGTLVFENNQGNGGGAIFGDMVTIIDGTNLFANNAANGDGGESTAGLGGAIYANTLVTITAGTNTFISNTTGIHGGAIYSGEVTIIDGRNVFESNIAGNRGGAIFGDTVTILAGTNSFTANTAKEDGGAIYSNSVSIYAGTNVFTNNTARDSGGAIFGMNDVTISGGTNTFTNNTASDRGGAIYVERDTTLIADGGDISFRGNTHQGGTPNAIYMANFPNDKTLTLAAEAGQSILFYDPIESNSVWMNLIVSINEGASYTGTVLFDTYQSKIYGNTTVYGGTMALTNGAIYGADTDNQSFTLNSGATLLTDAKSNKIQATDITLESGSILAFDLTGADGVSQTTTNLLLTGTTVTGTPNTVDIHAFDGVGTFNLATKSNGTFTVPTNLTTHGEDITTTRASGIAALQRDNGDQTLQLTSNVTNGVVFWTNGSANDTWNASSTNWNTRQIDTNTSHQFLHGDAVVFDGGETSFSSFEVEIQDGGVTIAARYDTEDNYINPGMEIRNEEWTFTGGSISGSGGVVIDRDTADPTSATFLNRNDYTGETVVINWSELRIAGQDNIAGTSGVTLKNYGTLVFTADVDFFDKAITISDVGIIDAGTSQVQLSSVISGNNGELMVNSTGGGVLTLTGNNTYSGGTFITIGSTLEVTTVNALGTGDVELDDASLIFALNSGNENYGNVIDGYGLVFKNGISTLTLSSANTYTGDTIINGGALLLNGSLTSDVTVNGGGTFGGTNGTSSGSLVVASGGTFLISSDTAGNYTGVVFAGSGDFHTGSIIDTSGVRGTGRFDIFDSEFTNVSNAQSALDVFQNPLYQFTAGNDGWGYIISAIRGQAVMSDAYVNALLMHDPWTIREAVRWNSYNVGEPVSGDVRGQSKLFSNQSAWVNYVGRSNELDSTFYQGRHAKFETNGIQTGLDVWSDRSSQFGVLFGYENHQQSIGNLGDNVKADDFYFGLYGSRNLGCCFDLRGSIGYGRQSYDLWRNGFGTIHRADFEGDTFETSLELGRTIRMGRHFSLRPFAGLDVYNNAIDGATEDNGGLTYSNTSLTQSHLRFGSDFRYARKCWNLYGSTFYARQLASKGDVLRTSVSDGVGTTMLYGSDLGNSIVTFTAGTNYVLDARSNWILFANYFGDVHTDRTGTPMQHSFQAGVQRRF